MQAITAPNLIDKGVLIYVPPSETLKCLVSIEINYTKTHPKFMWSTCDDLITKIWQDEKYESSKGDIFAFRSELQLGFYTLKVKKLSPDSRIKQGSLTIGIIKPTPYLVIGVPYSIYPPITLV